MAAVSAIGAGVLLGALALFQLALIAGAPLGHMAWGGQARILPTPLRISSAASTAIYVAIAALLLDAAQLIDLMPDAVSEVGAWVSAGLFGLGIVMNLISRSIAERVVMTPVAAALCVFSVLVALN